MRNTRLAKRLRRDRPLVQVDLKMPEDVVEDLIWVSQALGFSDYRSLIRAYVGQGLRADLARLRDVPNVSRLEESMKKHGIQDDIIASVIGEVTTVGEMEVATATL